MFQYIIISQIYQQLRSIIQKLACALMADVNNGEVDKQQLETSATICLETSTGL